MNVIACLGFEPTYYEVVVKHFRHYSMGSLHASKLFLYTYAHAYSRQHTPLNLKMYMRSLTPKMAQTCSCLHSHIYIYMHTHTHTHIHTYIYILLSFSFIRVSNYHGSIKRLLIARFQSSNSFIKPKNCKRNQLHWITHVSDKPWHPHRYPSETLLTTNGLCQNSATPQAWRSLIIFFTQTNQRSD